MNYCLAAFMLLASPLTAQTLHSWTVGPDLPAQCVATTATIDIHTVVTTQTVAGGQATVPPSGLYRCVAPGDTWVPVAAAGLFALRISGVGGGTSSLTAAVLHMSGVDGVDTTKAPTQCMTADIGADAKGASVVIIAGSGSPSPAGDVKMTFDGSTGKSFACRWLGWPVWPDWGCVIWVKDDGGNEHQVAAPNCSQSFP